uniref:General transcription factor IIA, 1-like n=1 Tax=Gasterosteus aculeatus aculeatus TaxID=481459 RepID=A0AAQ4PTS3_GASAC
MLTNTAPVAKLYLSIIDDVIESMRELFTDEGLEDRVLDDLRQIWESKMMQSKAMEDYRKSNINSSNFVLQLPANYNRTNQELTASVVIPNNSGILPTFSLPAGLSYPVQIPAGVTLQTASGQLYKVNVPVVVTQAPAGQPPVSRLAQVIERRESPDPPSTAAPPDASRPPQEAEALSAPAISDKQQQQQQQQQQQPPPPHPKTNFPPGEESALPQQPLVPPAEASQPPGAHFPQPEAPPGESEPNPPPEPATLCASASPCSQLLDFQISTEEALTQTGQLRTNDLDDILKEVIEEERGKAVMARKTVNQSDADLGVIKKLISLLLEVCVCVCTLISLVLQHVLITLVLTTHLYPQDPLNSGDDVVEQDIPDLFDTDNVIVCQYDKIHRSKNRWKFHLKDGVICYGGRDYVFSKAVGEAEW